MLGNADFLRFSFQFLGVAPDEQKLSFRKFLHYIADRCKQDVLSFECGIVAHIRNDRLSSFESEFFAKFDALLGTGGYMIHHGWNNLNSRWSDSRNKEFIFHSTRNGDISI